MSDAERITKLECAMRRAGADIEALYNDPIIGGDFIKRCLAVVFYQLIGWLIIGAAVAAMFLCSLLFRLGAVL